MDQEVAVVHGNYLTHGGGEVVAERLASLFDAPLYYGFGDPEAIPENDTEHVKLFDGTLLNRLDNSMYFRDVYSMWGWQHVPELHGYDVLIQSGNEMGWYVPPDDQAIVKYVHSTPRIPYDQFPTVGADPVTRLYAFLVRLLYLPNIPYPDQYVANSELVSRRVQRYWGVDDVDVAYPPVDIDTYHLDDDDEFYLTFSRLTASKRIDEIVDAFAGHPNKRLIVGGTGPAEPDLRRRAGPNVEFHGFLEEGEKRDLLARAKAFVFAARNEDFGIVPVEALASGTPVVGIRDGYTQVQVRDGENGLLYDRGVENLAAAIERFERDGVSMSPTQIREEARQYGVEAFERQMRSAVSDALDRATIEAGT